MAKKFSKNNQSPRDDADEKTYKKNKSNRNSRTGKDAGSRDFRRSSKGAGRNDVSWYVPDAQMLLDTGRWPYSRPVGTPLSRDSLLNLADQEDDAVPGICAIGLTNTIGTCNTGHDPANVAANAVYTFIRHANSGSRNYDANDLMLYIMAMDSIYYTVSWITRIYATVGMYSSMNKYLPDDLASVQEEVDLDSIRDNMANFRARINALILKIGSLVVPDTMPIFKRHSWLYANYYSEGELIKDQIYLFFPKNIRVFQLDSTGAGMLRNYDITEFANAQGKLDADSFVNMLDAMITPIFNDEDFNIMGGDILKAYGDSILRLALLPDLLVAQPVYNYEVLNQIKNCRFLNVKNASTSSDMDIVQDVNKEFLIQNFSNPSLFRIANGVAQFDSDKALDPDVYKIAYDEWSRPLVLTTQSGDVTPEENMVNTRLTVSTELEVDTSDPAGIKIKDICFGSEIPTTYRFLYHDKAWNRRILYASTVVAYDMTNISQIEYIKKLQNMASSFRFHPAISFIGYDKTSSPVSYGPSGLPLLQIDNFTTIDVDHVRALHEVAILGEFSVPRLAIVK